MTESPNQLDVIGPLLPCSADRWEIVFKNGCWKLLAYGPLGVDIEGNRLMAAIASILNAAPAQAAEIESLRLGLELGRGGMSEVVAENARLRAQVEALRCALVKLIPDRSEWLNEWLVDAERYCGTFRPTFGDIRNAANLIAEMEPRK